jgi:hypothetical protein
MDKKSSGSMQKELLYRNLVLDVQGRSHKRAKLETKI